MTLSARTFALLPALLAACGAGRRSGPPPIAKESSFDDRTTVALVEAIVRERARQQIPGLWIRLETRDGRVFRAAVGSRDWAGLEPATLEDCVRVGSVTKLIVAMAAMRLWERGLLTLDDPLARWAPGVPGAGSITVEQLLSHRAGLPDVLGTGSAVYATLARDHEYSRAELLRKISGRARFAPGSRVEYSNGNAVALGIALEGATGKPIRAILQDEVLGPVGARSTALLPDGPARACLVTGHDRDLVPFGHENRPADRSFASLAWTSGALATTADDLAAIVRGLRDATVVSSETLARMLPTVPVTTMDGGERRVGLGLFAIDIGEERLLGHAGQFIGSQALAGWFDDGTLLVVIGNRSAFEPRRIAERVLQAVRDFR